MNSKRSLQIEMEGLTGLRSLVETYEEIAAQRMQKVREEVLIARQFLDGLAGVFGEVRAAQKQKPACLSVNRHYPITAVR